jgi:hypothetical protein
MGGKVANRFALRHHYLHRRRAGKCVCYGVLWKKRFEGILIFAWPPVSHPMFGYKPGRIVELARVWFEHNPKNIGSCAIRLALRRIQTDWPGTEAIISWCDRTRFDGALYKATGFQFMGKSRVRAREASAAKYSGGRQRGPGSAARSFHAEGHLLDPARRVAMKRQEARSQRPPERIPKSDRPPKRTLEPIPADWGTRSRLEWLEALKRENGVSEASARREARTGPAEARKEELRRRPGWKNRGPATK